MGEIVCLPAPFKVCDLISSVRMIERMQSEKRRQRKGRPQERSEEDTKVIAQAKAVLIRRNSMTEPDAHRYLQKCSMDSGTGIAEAARMVLSLYQ